MLNKLAIIGVFVFGILIGQIATPLWKELVMRYNQASYAELVEKCDSSMKSHLMAKHRVVVVPNAKNVRQLEVAEIGLISCQEYDLKRKRLIQWGLNDNELSKMGLLAIESNSSDLNKLVNIHEFRY